jgi:hypothetical protein
MGRGGGGGGVLEVGKIVVFHAIFRPLYLKTVVNKEEEAPAVAVAAVAVMEQWHWCR